MIHKLLAGKGKMKRGLSLLLCLALLGSTAMSVSVLADDETEISTQEADSENLSEDVNTDSEDASVGGTLVISVSDDTGTDEQSSDTDDASDTDSDDGIMLTANNSGNYSGHIDVRLVTDSFEFTQTITESSTQKITVTKVWDDEEDHSGDSVTVYLTDEDGNKVTDSEGNYYTLTLNEGNDWTGAWDGLTLDAGDYSVEEVTVTGYTSSATSISVGEAGSTTDTVTVKGSLELTGINETLTYTHNGTTYTTTGKTDGSDTLNGKTVKEYHFQNRAYASESAQGTNISLSDGDKITVVVTFKATYTVYDSEGNVIASATNKEFKNYTYTETVASANNYCNASGYDFYVYPEDLLESIIEEETNTITVTNTPVTTIDILVVKEWNDNNDEYGIRPDSVTVTLCENGEKTDTTLTLTANDDWTGTFEDLPETDSSGAEIKYTVVETAVTGYISRQSTDEDTGAVTITNTPETVSIPVTKEWDDYDDSFNTRPDSITVTLYKNGEETDNTLTLEADTDDSWTGTFANLPKYYKDDSGVVKEITYTVNEDSVANYTSEISGSTSAGYVITNKLKTVTITIKKQVTGNMGDRTKEFEISYTTNVSDVPGASLSLTDYVTNGVNNNVGTVTLPVGSTITLTETNAEGYDKITVSYGSKEYVVSNNTAQTITIEDGVTEITVINYKNATPDTGVILDSAPYILMLAGVAILGGVVLFRRRRKLL